MQGADRQFGSARLGGKIVRGGLAAVGLMAIAGLTAPAAAQVRISIGTDHHRGYDRPGYRTITDSCGTVVYDRHYRQPRAVATYSRPVFFSSHGIGTRKYRSDHYRVHSSVLPATGYSVVTPGYASRSSVYVNTIACPPPPPPTIVEQRVYVQPVQPQVIEQRVYVEPAEPKVIERTVIVERDDSNRYGREDRRSVESARTLLDDAERAHEEGDWHTAIRLYEESISYRSSVASARRGLALIYLETDNVTDGLRLLERAYEEEPTLAVRVFDDRILAGERLGRMIEDAQRNAERQCSAKSWLAVAVLRQSAGDRQGAREAIGEAARYGLNSRVVDSWYNATDR